MAIIFPSDPVLDEEFTAEGKTWYWSGEKWAFASTSAETISAASPITYSASTQIIGINQTLLSVEQSQVSNLTTSLSSKAPLDSPGLTGTPTAPTATAGANTTQVATTQFVSTAVSNIIGAAPETLNTLNELAEALGDDANFATSVFNAIDLKVAKAGDSMTGPLSISTSSTSPALTVTQTGSGFALLVEDETNPDSTPFSINESGRILTGSTQTRDTGPITGRIQINTTDPFEGGIASYAWTNDSSAQVTTFNKSRGTSAGVMTSVSVNDNLGDLRFAGSNGSSFVRAASIIAAVDGTPGVGDMPGRLVFSTTADGGSVPTERMRINNAGNVGIGITNPTSKLEVNGVGTFRTGGKSGTNTYLSLKTTDASNEMELGFFQSTNQSWTIQSVENGVAYRNLLFNPSGGKIGIGTTTPDTILHLRAPTPIFRIEDTGVKAAALDIRVANDEIRFQGTAYVTSDQPMTFYTANLERLRITSAGNVGIGKTNPDYALDVNGTVNATTLLENGLSISSTISEVEAIAILGL